MYEGVFFSVKNFEKEKTLRELWKRQTFNLLFTYKFKWINMDWKQINY